MKIIISDIWLGIKKAPFLFFFIFIQIVITSVVLYSMLATFYWTEEQSVQAQITWGDNEYLKILDNASTPRKVLMPIVSSLLNHSAKTERDRHDNLIRFYKIDSFYKELKEDPDITVLVCQDFFHIVLYEPKEWEEDDKTTEVGLLSNEGGSFHPFDNVKTLIVSSNYLEYFGVKLSEGEYFKKEDYLYEGDYVPVLMGSIYKKYYKIGDEFDGMFYTTKNTKFKVVGFIAENQYYTTPASYGSVKKYDNYIVVPDFEKDLD